MHSKGKQPLFLKNKKKKGVDNTWKGKKHSKGEEKKSIDKSKSKCRSCGEKDHRAGNVECKNSAPSANTMAILAKHCKSTTSSASSNMALSSSTSLLPYYVRIDTAEDIHIQKDQGKLFNFDETTSIDLQGYNGLGGRTCSLGEMLLTFISSTGERNMVIVKDVHWILDVRDACLLSVRAVYERGCKFTLNGKGVSWTLSSSQLLSYGVLQGRAYLISCEAEEVASISIVGRIINEWHRALAHASTDTI